MALLFRIYENKNIGARLSRDCIISLGTVSPLSNEKTTQIFVFVSEQILTDYKHILQYCTSLVFMLAKSVIKRIAFNTLRIIGSCTCVTQPTTTTTPLRPLWGIRPPQTVSTTACP